MIDRPRSRLPPPCDDTGTGPSDSNNGGASVEGKVYKEKVGGKVSVGEEMAEVEGVGTKKNPQHLQRTHGRQPPQEEHNGLVESTRPTLLRRADGPGVTGGGGFRWESSAMPTNITASPDGYIIHCRRCKRVDREQRKVRLDDGGKRVSFHK